MIESKVSMAGSTWYVVEDLNLPELHREYELTNKQTRFNLQIK